jgi:hypothetical protein
LRIRPVPAGKLTRGELWAIIWSPGLKVAYGLSFTALPFGRTSATLHSEKF